MKKIIFSILFVLGLQLSPTAFLFAQTASLSYPKEALAERINKISKDTGATISFDAKPIQGLYVPSLHSNGNVEDALDKTLSNTNWTYKKVSNNSYVVIPRKPASNAKPKGQLSVSGIVLDENGEALIGATVEVKNEKRGTLTNENGQYTLSGISGSAILLFRYIGFETKEVPIEGKQTMNVTLEESEKTLSEVIVIGYGVARKKDLTGSISSLDGTEITNRQNTQISSALQGVLPGVTVTRSSSAPGAGADIRIRGITSMRNNGPLIIVDGIAANSINDVNPYDIENLTVLKDAASASIYGARAASGVILITTKRGSKKNINIDYNYNYSMDFASDMPDYADAVTYMKIVNEREWNASGAVSGTNEYSIYDQDLIDNYWTLNKENPDEYPNTDWLKLILKDYAPRQSHQIGITAGNEKYQTKVGLGYDKVDGLFKSNLSWDRVTARVNNDITINNWLSTSIDVNLKKTSSTNPAYSPSLQMRYAAPVYAGVYSDGRLAAGKDGTNPYGKMMYGGTSDSDKYLAGAKASLTIKPIKNLSITGVFAPTYNFSKDKTFTKQVQYYTSFDEELPTGILDGTKTMSLTENRDDSHSLNTQLFVNYIKEFGRHSINSMLGYEDYYYFNESLMAARDQYQLSYYPYLDAGPETLQTNSGDAYENAYRSYFGRLMYNWNQRYYFQFNLRHDGSSRFHKDHRWGTFPSVSAAWIASEEPFIKNIPMISMLKFRGSWGQLGDERIGNYTYQSYMSFNNPTLYIGDTPSSVQGASAYQYAIKENTWETTTTTDIGLDLYTLNNRLRFSGDYYWKNTKDMLIAVDIPNFMGFSDPYQNIGKMKTTGWEFELGWNDRIGDLKYGVSVNLYDYKSVMGYLKDTRDYDSDNWTVTMEGSEYLSYYGYLSDGIYQTGDELGATTSSAVGIGDIRYKDISGPDGVPDGSISAEYDRTVIGSSLPRFNYGGSVNLDYKGFDFLLTFQGVGKKDAILTEQMAQPVRADWYNVPEIILGKYWSNYNSDEQNAKAQYPRIMRDANTNNYAASDFWLFDGSYFRIKNITLGYSVPLKLINKMSINKLRIYASLQDFFTISHYPKGWDPEVSSTGYPITKSLTFGASIQF
jgi:TonB-linked SusC/RagA family outer membrane protein